MNFKDLAVKVSLLAVVAVLLGVFLWNSDQQPPITGKPMPDFDIAADKGPNVKLDDYRGKILVLNFWASWCQPCIEELPSLEAFQRAFRSRGVEVVAVSVDDDDKAYKDFVASHPLSFKLIRDPDKRVSINYGTFRYPESYIADRNGNLLRKIAGPADWMDDGMVTQMQEWLKAK